MRTTNLGGVTNLITQLADYSVLRHRSRTPRLVIIVVATLRYGSRTPGLVVKDAATTGMGAGCQDGWVKDRFGTEETEDDAILSREGLVTIEHKDGACLLYCSSVVGLVWASTGDGRGRWTSIPNRFVEEERRRLVVMC
ncbi:hypothetical protein BHE74_00035695 [Ensete ventricosum]|nr:hypothetical protein BHE74_00035695 [Ensete ventricosum]